MAVKLANVDTWLQGLQPRERTVLKYAAPIVLAILLVGTQQTLSDAAAAAAKRLDAASRVEARLPSELPKLRSSVAAATSVDVPLGIRIEPLVEGEVRAVIEDVEFVAVLRYVAARAETGYRLTTVKLQKTADGRVSGEILQTSPR